MLNSSYRAAYIATALSTLISYQEQGAGPVDDDRKQTSIVTKVSTDSKYMTVKGNDS